MLLIWTNWICKQSTEDEKWLLRKDSCWCSLLRRLSLSCIWQFEWQDSGKSRFHFCCLWSWLQQALNRCPRHWWREAQCHPLGERRPWIPPTCWQKPHFSPTQDQRQSPEIKTEYIYMQSLMGKHFNTNKI